MKQVTCHGQRDPSSLTLPLQQRASKSFARREGLHYGRAYEVRSVGSLSRLAHRAHGIRPAVVGGVVGRGRWRGRRGW